MSTKFWKCPSCTLENGESLQECQLCNTFRPKSAVFVGTKTLESSSVKLWNCPACTFPNGDVLMACQMCETVRPAAEIALVEEKPPKFAWVCSNCHLGNTKEVPACSACSKPRSGVASPPNLSKSAPPQPPVQIEVPPGSWLCPSCTFTNDCSLAKCSVCQARAPDHVPVAGALPIPQPDEFKGREMQRFGRDRKWRRNDIVVGVLDNSAFQASIRYSGNDPLLVKIFDGLGWHCIPYIGTYGDPYDFVHPMLTVELPVDHLFSAANHGCPPHLVDLLRRHAVIPKQIVAAAVPGAAPLYDFKNIEFYLIIHDRIHSPPPIVAAAPAFATDDLKEAGSAGTVLNLVPHMWLFRDLPFAPDVNLQEKILMGIFSSYGVGMMEDSSSISDGAGGAPFELLFPRVAVLHDCRFSPNNARFRLLPGYEFHSFFSFISTMSGDDALATLDPAHVSRQVITFHVIAGNQRIQELLRAAVKTAVYITDLLEIFTKVPALSLLALQMQDVLRPFLIR